MLSKDKFVLDIADNGEENLQKLQVSLEKNKGESKCYLYIQA